MVYGFRVLGFVGLGFMGLGVLGFRVRVPHHLLGAEEIGLGGLGSEGPKGFRAQGSGFGELGLTGSGFRAPNSLLLRFGVT